MAEAKDRKTRMAELKTAREKEYFDAQAAAKTATEGILPDLPASDVFNYSYAWRQDVGAPTGEYKLIKTPNGLYDPSTNEIIDPVTGARTPMTLSMWSGPSSFRADAANVKNPKTGLTKAQEEAAALLAQAKGNAATLAAQLGAKIDPKTGKVDTSTIDPAKAAVWYNSQLSSNNNLNAASTVNSDGTINTNNAVANAAAVVTQNPNSPGTAAYDARKSAYDLLYTQFAQYGLQSLVEPLKGLILEGISPSEFTIRLRDTDAYKKRFAANQQRIQRGLTALSEAEYISLEDQYQSIMRNYGLPSSYYARGDMGRQEGFEKFIAGDVSAAELEDRIVTAQNRVINAAPEVSKALREFYPDITNGDILAYTLDPDKAISEIRRKVTAAEIGAGALQAGLATGVSRAEELGRYGVTADQARQGYQNIADVLPRGSQLADIYKQSPYTQTTAEQEVFGLAGATDAAKQRKKLTSLEQASFAGSSGLTSGALARDRAGAF